MQRLPPGEARLERGRSWIDSHERPGRLTACAEREGGDSGRHVERNACVVSQIRGVEVVAVAGDELRDVQRSLFRIGRQVARREQGRRMAGFAGHYRPTARGNPARGPIDEVGRDGRRIERRLKTAEQLQQCLAPLEPHPEAISVTPQSGG